MKSDVLFIPRFWFTLYRILSPLIFCHCTVKRMLWVMLGMILKEAKECLCFSAFQHLNSTDNGCSLVLWLPTASALVVF